MDNPQEEFNTSEQSLSRKKPSKDEKINKVEIKNKERLYFTKVFKRLCDLEQEASSDDDSKEKKYWRKIEKQVKLKKMKIPDNKFKSKTLSKAAKTENKKFEETSNDPHYQDPESEESILRKSKFGIKALRKIIRQLTGSFNKNNLKLMIWEIDSNLDGFVSYEEYERMYKRCIADDKEHEPKKLYTLVQFLMFDKDCKGVITVEDTLEIWCVRNTKGIDEAIDSIFNIETKDEKGNVINTGEKHEEMTFIQFAERMHNLSLRKRNELMNKKNYFART